MVQIDICMVCSDYTKTSILTRIAYILSTGLHLIETDANCPRYRVIPVLQVTIISLCFLVLWIQPEILYRRELNFTLQYSS